VNHVLSRERYRILAEGHEVTVRNGEQGKLTVFLRRGRIPTVQSGELVKKFEQSIKPCVDIAVLFIYLFSMSSFRRAYLSQRDHSFSSGYMP
jgi:hypothetical protein